MARIIKEITGEAAVVITETYIDETHASENKEPDERKVKVIDFKVSRTNWKTDYDK